MLEHPVQTLRLYQKTAMGNYELLILNMQHPLLAQTRKCAYRYAQFNVNCSYNILTLCVHYVCEHVLSSTEVLKMSKDTMMAHFMHLLASD